MYSTQFTLTKGYKCGPLWDLLFTPSILGQHCIVNNTIDNPIAFVLLAYARVYDRHHRLV